MTQTFHDQSNTRGTPVAAALTVGFGVMVAMWVVWFLTHMPATTAMFPPVVAGPVLLSVLVVGTWAGVRAVPQHRRPATGALAGLVAGVVNLLVLFSFLTEGTGVGPDPAAKAQAAEAGVAVAQVKPGAALMAGGWLAVCAVGGLLAGLAARATGGGATVMPSDQRWLARFAWVTCAAIVPLLALGGLVTTSKAGFAVPDWPGTYGGNMFLYPVELMNNPRVYLEHTHRLFGSMVGLTTLVLCVFALVVAPRTWQKLAGVGLLALVIVQGVLGGLWTQDKQIWMVLVHGTLGQLFLGLTAAFATTLGGAWRAWRDDRTPAGMRVPRVGTVVLVVLLLVMLVFGTMIRHMNHSHALWSHVGFSIVPVIVAVIIGAGFMKHKALPTHGRRLWWIGHVPMILVGVQFALGWAALLAFLSDPTRKIEAPVAEALASAPQIDPIRLLVRTVHQANGALLMGSAWVMLAWGLARRRA
jgi:cytochrome c oxidase assembly protein subunit 15